MSVIVAILIVTALVAAALIGYVVWLNWIDVRSERTIGRDFDYYAGRNEYEEKHHRFRDKDE